MYNEMVPKNRTTEYNGGHDSIYAKIQRIVSYFIFK